MYSNVPINYLSNINSKFVMRLGFVIIIIFIIYFSINYLSKKNFTINVNSLMNDI